MFRGKFRFSMAPRTGK